MKIERWKDVPGYEGLYQVSDKGRVRSVDRVVEYVDGRVPFLAGRILRQRMAGSRRDYAVVNLWRGKQRRTRYVHDLVLSAFVGLKPIGKEVCHGPQGQGDNHLRNLSYGTHSQNMRDCRRDGTGINKPVRRSDGKEYDSIDEAARDIGACPQNITHVLHGRLKQCKGFTWEFIND